MTFFWDYLCDTSYFSYYFNPKVTEKECFLESEGRYNPLGIDISAEIMLRDKNNLSRDISFMK